MHLHSMRIAAIGPFAGEHTINFAELGAGGIFLLEGPTGAGKSTIIDAIVFALFGKVAASDASEERLRSTHVGPEVESSVDLIFETGHGIFRILRSPAYDRPKQRGTGTVRQNVKVQLWRLTSPESLGTGEQMSTRADEVGAEVTRLIGLSREQFVQTIVLPQGEFASFLKAKPEERRGLLQRVFGTEIYQRLQAELVAGRARAKQELAGAQAAVSTAAAGFEGAAGLAAEQMAELEQFIQDADTDSLLARLAELVDRQSAAVTEAESHAAEAGRVRNAALGAEQAARTLAKCVTNRDDLTRRKATLEENAEAHHGRRAQVTAATQAGHVAAYLAATDRAASHLEAVERDLTDAFTRTPWIMAAHVDGAQQLGQWHLGAPGPVPGALNLDQHIEESVRVDPHGQIAQRRERIAGLRRAATLEAALPGRLEELTGAEADLSTGQTARADLATNQTERPAARALLEERRRTAAEAGNGVSSLQTQAAHAATAHDHARKQADVGQEIARIEPEIASAHAAAAAAVTHVAALRRARIDGMAGELAAGLETGQPCVVCGATEHPAPAARGEDHVSGGAVAAAEEVSRVAEEELARLSQVRAEYEKTTALHRAGSGGQSVEDTAANVARIADELTKATEALDRAVELTALLDTFDAETENLRVRIAEQDEALAAQTATLAALRTAIGQEQAEVAAGLAAAAVGGDIGVGRATDLIATATSQITAIEAVIAHLAARKRVLSEVDRARADALAALAKHGFADENAAKAALLETSVVNELTRAIAAHEQEDTLVTAGLAAEDIRVLDADLTAQGVTEALEQAHARAQEATKEADLLGARAATIAETRNRSVAAATKVREAVAKSADLGASLAPILRIANLADATSSDNTSALTLGTFVLTRRFEEVLGAANDRLREMSSGRYALERSSEKETRGGRRLGLALKVLDHHTATQRDPSTLSGGETFYVSLCLALGLADIVTAEAGGVDLGTLFVDEGFGSLDPETLEVVMGELGRLRAGGRMVGVVSHVEAMKSTIADRIAIRRVDDGSSTLTVLAGTS